MLSVRQVGRMTARRARKEIRLEWFFAYLSRQCDSGLQATYKIHVWLPFPFYSDDSRLSRRLSHRARACRLVPYTPSATPERAATAATRLVRGPQGPLPDFIHTRDTSASSLCIFGDFAKASTLSSRIPIRIYTIFCRPQHDESSGAAGPPGSSQQPPPAAHARRTGPPTVATAGLPRKLPSGHVPVEGAEKCARPA